MTIRTREATSATVGPCEIKAASLMLSSTPSNVCVDSALERLRTAALVNADDDFKRT